MDRSKFYEVIRDRNSGMFGATLTKRQVDGIERILDEAERRATPLRHLAYILATTYHETAHTMQPVREMGGEKYLRSKKYYPWVGEGLVQVTWEVNHRKFGATAPGQMMTWPIALKAIFDGMTLGMFTGKKLDDYINDNRADYVAARRIVNGTDRSLIIGEYAKTFERALRAAGYGSGTIASPPTPKPSTPAPSSPPVAAPRHWLVVILSAIVAFFYRRNKP